MATIPVSVAPSSVMIYSLDESPILTADRAVIFSLPLPNSGSLEVLSSNAVRFHPINRSQDVIVQVVSQSNPADTASVLLKVWGHIPHYPAWGAEVDLDNKTLVSTAEDDSEVMTVKRGPLQTWRFVFADNDFPEKEALLAFWRYHQKHRYWYYRDLSEGDALDFEPMTYFVRFDSGLKIVANHPDSFQITCVVTERPLFA